MQTGYYSGTRSALGISGELFAERISVSFTYFAANPLGSWLKTCTGISLGLSGGLVHTTECNPHINVKIVARMRLTGTCYRLITKGK